MTVLHGTQAWDTGTVLLSPWDTGTVLLPGMGHGDGSSVPNR